MTNTPPPNTDAQKRLEKTIGILLHQIPDAWQEYRSDDLTEIQSRAQLLLVAAGMVEQQKCFRLRMINQPIAIEATIKLTGESGIMNALDYLCADLWSEWEEAYCHWENNEAKDTVPIHCELLHPEKWRLTDMGVMAKENFDKGEKRDVLNFVLKQGIYDGQPRIMPNGQRIHRIPVPGYGSLVKMEKKSITDLGSETTQPQTVNIGNWDEGCEKLSQVIALALDQRLKEKHTQTNHPLKPKKKMKRSQSEPLIAAYLARRPHDTAQEVADEVGCSKGVVAESPSWKANQKKLADSGKKKKNPLKLSQGKSLSGAGDDKQSQVQYQNEQQESIDEDIDRRDKELFKQIAEYQKEHPKATTQEVAKHVGCTAGEIERRQAMIDKLANNPDDETWKYTV